MTSRDIKFIGRIIIMFMMALVAALGVRVFLESDELAKLVNKTPLRDLLLFISPLASLAILHYSLALKSYGIRSLLTEGFVFISVACIFFSITAPYYLGVTVYSPEVKCDWWRIIGCSGTRVKSRYWILFVIIPVGLLSFIQAMRRERIVKNNYF